MVMPLAQQAVMKPASPPVRARDDGARGTLQIVHLDPLRRHFGHGADRFGTMIEAPSAVMVPETLMMGLKPSRSRIVLFEPSAEVVFMSVDPFSRSSGGDLDDRLDFNGDVSRQRTDADRGAGMAAQPVEDTGEKVRTAIDHFRVIAKVSGWR